MGFGIKTQAIDRVFSLYIRTRDKWTCQRCGKNYENKKGSLDCSHFYGRRSWSTRVEPCNAMALCKGCHLYVGGNPIEHTKLWEGRFTTQEREQVIKRYQDATIRKKDVNTPENLKKIKEMLNEAERQNQRTS